MGTGKKDLEIVYNLQWKKVSGHGDDKANIVGMYDIPATTLNWETFKSYLLKNSGATGDDVKVSYVSIDDKEFPIESQLDFQIALYSFRQRARNGDIITLKLDRIGDNLKMGRIKRLRRSAEPRMEEEKVQVAEPSSTSSSNDLPPEWFKKYMKGFKKEVVEEVTSSVIGYMANQKAQNVLTTTCHHPRKLKVEYCKRPRKGLGEISDKELIKSQKMERRLDSKLERLEQKTMKIKEKKMALVRSNESEGSRNNIKSRPIGMPLSDAEFLMDASAVGNHESTIQHMLGGEIYQQEWEVVNSGEMPWGANTELRYAWGSEALKPIEKTVLCPQLNPGEKGTVNVFLEIPRKPGNYECYWHFYHEGRRFGHWLGCHIIVDPSPLKAPSLPSMVDEQIVSESLVNSSWTSTSKKLKKEELVLDLSTPPAVRHDNLKFFLMSKMDSMEKPLNTAADCMENKTEESDIRDMGATLEALQIDEPLVINLAETSSDSDNQSIVSIADSNSSVNSAPSDEFVVVAMPQSATGDDDDDESGKKDIKAENLCIPMSSKIKLEKIDPNDQSFENSDNNNNTEAARQPVESIKESINEVKEETTPICNEIQQQETLDIGYAYIYIDGKKVAVPKRLLRLDFLENAENAPPPTDKPLSSANVSTTEAVQETADEKPINLADEQQKDPIQNSKVTQSIYVSAECIPKSSQCSVAEDDCVSNKTNYSSKSRLFVFPQNCPGFEVVYPPNPLHESLPPELTESFESNHTSMAVDGSTISQHSCGGCSCTADYKTDARNEPLNYNWSKSNSSYSYPAPPPCANLEFDPSAPPAQNESGVRNRLHHRFSTYMRYRIPFNHSKQYGSHYHQQHWPTFHAAANQGFANPKVPPPNGAANYPMWSPERTNSYQQTFGTYASASSSATGSTKAQSPIHTSDEVPNGPAGGVNGERPATIHILPDTLVSGAVNVASSAINTARSVLNMFTPPAPSPARPEQTPYENTRWAANEAELPRERALRILAEMGFWDCDLNATLLARYNDDLARVISELVQ